MDEPSSSHPRRVLVPQALGADEFLRVTWHDGNQIVVFSHWRGDTCIAATPVRVTELGELASLLTRVTGDEGDEGDEQNQTAFDPPDIDALPWRDAEPA